MKMPSDLPGVVKSKMHGNEEWGCVLSEDDMAAPYRYVLWREWDPRKPCWMYVMLNPSKASHLRSDRSVTRCMNRAKVNGAGGIVVVNSGAYRETDSKVACAHPDPVGPHNERWVRALIPYGDIHIAAWGKAASSFGGDETMKRIFAEEGVRMYAIRQNQDGSPSHPSREGDYHRPLVPYDFS